LFGLRGRQTLRAGRLEALELVEGAVIVALAGIDQALEAFEGKGAGDEGVAGRAGIDGRVFLQEDVGGVVPQFGFDAPQAAQAPLVMDEGIDEEPLDGVGRAVLLVVLGGKLGEIAGGFVEHDLMRRVDAVLEGVELGCGLLWGGGVWFGSFHKTST